MIGIKRGVKHGIVTAQRPGVLERPTKREKFDEKNRERCLSCPLAECRKGVCPMVVEK